MLISTTTVIALRCPVCGQLDFHDLSLFHFANKASFKIECSCGAELLTVGTKDCKNFWLQLKCVLCETRHVYHRSRKEIWGDQALTVCCEETGLEIGYIGSREEVKRCIQNQEKSLSDLAEDLGFTDYFENQEVMYEVLDCLYRIAEQGNLYCQCGNHDVEIEIFPDRLELKCNLCHSTGVVKAESETDLEAVRQMWEIQLTENGFKFRDLRKLRRSRKHSKK
ncbi:MAG: hypothetical protein ACYCX4_13725 [Bacillota bacterium]